MIKQKNFSDFSVVAVFFSHAWKPHMGYVHMICHIKQNFEIEEKCYDFSFDRPQAFFRAVSYESQPHACSISKYCSADFSVMTMDYNLLFRFSQ